MTAKGIVGFVLLLAATAGSWYLAKSLSNEEIEITSTGAVGSGFYLRAARILGTSIEGQLLYEIEADFAEQVSEDLIQLQNVHINYSAESDVPWRLAADSATITGELEFLMLEGHVIATSAAGFSGDVTEIRTEYLELDPRQYKAETDRRVQVRIGSRSLTATGMLALLQDNQLTLKSNVNGKFVP
jgi:lipopolysaccharide export system protein LptC